MSFKDLDVAIAPTPEPSSLLGLIGAGALGAGLRRRKQKR
ncbi:MAG: PEP-CTERM sorting domain-containing protein [Cyanobacteriota bacterium]